jgi:hypothetical protein
MPGPMGFYIFKYHIKGTQEEDTEEYSHVKEGTQKALALSLESLGDSEHSVAMRRLLSTSFAHQKTNIVGAPMASFLIWHKSWFIMSHKSVWCPLHDIDAVLNGGSTFTTISHHGATTFFQSWPVHYLCQPTELEHLDLHDFFCNTRLCK